MIAPARPRKIAAIAGDPVTSLFTPAADYPRRRPGGTLSPAGSRTRRSPMNWDRVQGNWKQFSGQVKEQWGKLTDDDIARINGNREQLEGLIQSRYGFEKEQVKKAVDNWLKTS
jgi:uncharacterized protein YjbJ (UPF0337 family)